MMAFEARMVAATETLKKNDNLNRARFEMGMVTGNGADATGTAYRKCATPDPTHIGP